MSKNCNNFSHRRRQSAFTLIEIMVTVAIILILAILLLAVGGNVKRNAQISATRTELQGLAGLVEKFQQDNPGVVLKTTLYSNDAASFSQLYPTAAAPTNFVDALYFNPGTKNALVSLCGDRLKLAGSGQTFSYVVDFFGRPISFVRQTEVIKADVTGSNWATAADRDYLRSSGPDQTTDWTNLGSAQNSDDVLSYESGH